MKHPSSQALFQHWNASRGAKPAPDEVAFDLEACGDLLGDCFMLSGETLASARMTFAGSRLCGLFGIDARGGHFPGRWPADATSRLDEFVQYACEERVGTVAGIATLPPAAHASLELMLLPLVQAPGLAPRIVGSLAPISANANLAGAACDIGAWRHLGPLSEPAAQRPLPRAVRKIRLACGFLLYEGGTPSQSRMRG